MDLCFVKGRSQSILFCALGETGTGDIICYRSEGVFHVNFDLKQKYIYFILLWLILIVFYFQEERFLFPIYPFFALCGAVCFDYFQVRCLFHQSFFL